MHNIYKNELFHYGVKGMKWGTRRYQNPDGTLTAKGKKRYRRNYDDIKYDQTLAARSKTVNRTGISAIDNYNSDYYEKRSKNKLDFLMKKIGDKGISQLDDDVVNEGKNIANNAKRDAEVFNKSFDSTIDDSYLFLKDPEREYNYHYNKYMDDHLVRR